MDPSQLSPEVKKYVDEAIRIAIKMHRHDGVLTQNVYLSQIIDPASGLASLKWSLNLSQAFTSFAANTNGTTPVLILPGVPVSIGAVFLISNDTTAGTITVSNSAGTVCTIAKGTVAGAMVGAISLANSSAHTGLQIVSSSAGNARVIFILQYENAFAA
jgi:hypothetical protein